MNGHRHQRKQVETALRAAEGKGCRVVVRLSGHLWGHVVAPSGRRFRVVASPQASDAAAHMILDFVRKEVA